MSGFVSLGRGPFPTPGLSSALRGQTRNIIGEYFIGERGQEKITLNKCVDVDRQGWLVLDRAEVWWFEGAPKGRRLKT